LFDVFENKKHGKKIHQKIQFQL